MKQLLFVTLSCLCACSSGSNTLPDVMENVKTQIGAFYQATQVEDYSPVSYSDIDTAFFIADTDGTILKLSGSVIHKFKARAQNGSIRAYTDTFDIDVYKNEVVAIPRGY
ncbi:hypothetical protein I2I11_04210 [Pontibacter sp. 172403-2]|uniref:hypothetical protein n=1 Tax=Pontibacter rufus TaxID=2791028 RepID=UPI0018AF9355|nr:hypothetical protein [Pontibacter sp. 172403-2]MBF9252488.1 hypothetical protein [Pontibacter sp. 172403-2]